MVKVLAGKYAIKVISTGNQVSDNVAFTPWLGYDPTKSRSPALARLAQYKSDGSTAISEGGITTESSPDNPDNATVVFQAVATGPPSSQGNPSDWQEFGTAGNVDFEVNLSLSAKASELAKELVNYPYLWDGKGWDYNQHLFATVNAVKTGYQYYNPDIKHTDTGIGVDCSGLVMWAYDRSFDPNKSRFNNFVKAEGADEQYRYNTATTTESQLQLGDVMFFDWDANGFIDHVAMYVGNNGSYDVVSASSRREGIVARSKDTLENIAGFIAFKQVVSATPLAMLVSAHSPVDLIVTDPDGFTITPTTVASSSEEYLREIPGVLYYSEMEQGTDGNPIDQVYSYTAKTGDYVIRVLPASNATSTSTYTLDFSAGNQSITLAQNVSISQIPNQGYGVTTSATGTINTFIPVAIDIKHGSYPNSINLGSNGVVPVAIFGSATFDVRQIDPTTIKLANASVKLKGNSQPMVSYSDINGDGFIDIVVQVSTQALELTSSDVKANLEGQLMNGTIIKGSDSVRIVP